MLIGVPKEIKNHEYRVGLTPGSVRELVHFGHRVMVQSQAGAGIRLTDADYHAAGAEVVNSAEEIFAKAELVVKVKEPQPHECAMLRPNQVLFTYLHLAPDPEQAKMLMKIHKQVQDNITKANTRYKTKADKSRTDKRNLQVGDLMWVHLKKVRFPYKRKNKLMPKAVGPFRIVDQKGTNALTMNNEQ